MALVTHGVVECAHPEAGRGGILHRALLLGNGQGVGAADSFVDVTITLEGWLLG